MAGRLEGSLQAIGAFAILLALLPVAAALAGFEPFAPSIALILRTFLQAGLSAILAIVISLPLAWAMCENSFLTRIVRPLTLFPAIMPPIVMVLVATQLLGYSGLFPMPTILYSFWGVVLVHALYNFPLAARLINGAIPAMQGYSDISRVMSADFPARILKVWLPLLKPAIMGVFWVVFAYCFTSFSIPLIFGGGSASTIETEIYYLFYSRLDFGKAAFLAIVQLAVLIPFIMQLPSDSGIFRKPTYSPRKSHARVAILAAYLLIILIILASPFLKMAPAEVRAAPIINSFFIGSLAASLSLLLFLFIPPLFRKASYLLLAISSTTLALAYSGFAGSWPVVVAAHSLLALPMFQMAAGRRMEEVRHAASVASVAGAKFADRLFRITLPSLKKELLLGWLLGFFISLSDIVLVQVISAGQFDTISTVLISSFSHYRFSEGIFYSFLLICISIAAMAAAEWLNGD